MDDYYLKDVPLLHHEKVAAQFYYGVCYRLVSVLLGRMQSLARSEGYDATISD